MCLAGLTPERWEVSRMVVVLPLRSETDGLTAQLTKDVIVSRVFFALYVRPG